VKNQSQSQPHIFHGKCGVVVVCQKYIYQTCSLFSDKIKNNNYYTSTYYIAGELLLL
jgi:hypothetical protein